VKKILPLPTAFTDFTGEPMKDGEKNFTLKNALLGYLASAHLMGLSTPEEATAYEVGILVGTAKGDVTLEQNQYDVLKKLVDSGKLRQGQVESPVWPITVSQQTKRLVDGAEKVEETPKTK
jgi:hypothetical protein